MWRWWTPELCARVFLHFPTFSHFSLQIILIANSRAIVESNSNLPTRTTWGLSAVSNILPERAPQPISFIVHFRRIAQHSWLIHCLMTQSQHDTDTWSNHDNHSRIFDRRSSACTALGIVGLSLFSLLYCHLLRGALVCLVFWRVDTSKGF